MRVRAVVSVVLVCSCLLLGCAMQRSPSSAAPSLPPPPSSSSSAAPTSPVGAALPSGEECARRVVRHAREPRPSNATANAATPGPVVLPPWPDYWNPIVNRVLVPRVDGAYAGTTEDIIDWGACKWGMDPELIRAVAWTESSWYQSKAGDVEEEQRLCAGGDVAPCPTSFGLLQIKHIYRPGSYPLSRQSTSFNVDYGLAVIRGCYEGWVLYLRPPYAPGDLWGCLGWHYSGEWKNPLAQRYTAEVTRNLRDTPWTALAPSPGR